MKRTIMEGADYFDETLDKYKVDEIPEGLKKLTFYNLKSGRECKFTVRHYYVDYENKTVYRYYPVMKVYTAHKANDKKQLRVVDDDDKTVSLTFGPKLKNHLNNETELWNVNNTESLLKAW